MTTHPHRRNQLVRIATKENEIDKFSAVRRFISSFIYDLNNIKSNLYDEITVDQIRQLRKEFPNNMIFGDKFDELINNLK